VSGSVNRACGALRCWYGASWWHLAVLLGCFALTAYVLSRLVNDTSSLLQIGLWFVGAAVVWDLVLGPLLALADRGARMLLRRLRIGGVSPLNHVRFPALLSLLLLVVFAPLVLQRSEQRYSAKAALGQDAYLERWVAVTAALFAASALAYGLAVLRARRRS
jgi:hypothetical protein